MRRIAVIFMLAAAAASSTAGHLFAEITAEQQQQVADLEKSLKGVPGLIRAKKIEEATELVERAKETVSSLSSSEAKDELAPVIAQLQKKIAAAERVLEKAASGPSKSRKPAARKRPTENAPPQEAVNTDAISFTKQIVPIFTAKCAGCHIRMSKGGFSMATFADLKKGSESGTVFSPGKGEGSRLVEVLATGDMPRGGGGQLPADQIALITRWIDQGAKFDGKSETEPLAAGAATTPTAPMPAVQFGRASGSESVQFVRDLAPTIVSTCIDCHGGMQPAGRLNLTTFAGLLQGGTSGPIVVPGKPEESLLIKKLKGTAGQRMPLRKAPLSDGEIQKFVTWIAEGAKFDWADASETLDWAVRVTVASKMSHDELATLRAGLAEKNWRLGNPESKPETLVDEHFILVGNLSPTRMSEVAGLAKQAYSKVAKLLQLPTDEPFMKGKLTLFAFRRHFDYTEFGTMVERRELPTDWHGHFRYTVVDCYGCVLVPDDDKGVALTLAEVFAGAYIESQGKMPRWFVEGAARAIASRVMPKDPLAKQWDEQLRDAMAAGRTPDDFLKAGNVVSGDGAALSYGFMKGAVRSMPKFLALLRDLHGGASFDRAFERHMGGDPASLAAGWLGREGYRRN